MTLHRSIIAILLILLSFDTYAREFRTPYDRYIVNTAGDFIRVCQPLIKPDLSDTESFPYKVSCLSYVSGIITGYTSTLSLNAEYEVANKMGVSRSKMVEKIEADPLLHKKLEKLYFSSHFLCFSEEIGFYDIAKSVVQSLKDKDIDENKSAHYVVLNEIENLFPCSNK